MPVTDADMVEKVARALYEDATRYTDGVLPWDKTQALTKAVYRGHAQAAIRTLAPMVLDMAAEVCRNHMADCLEDKDIQRRWPQIRARNSVYADAILALREQFNAR